MSDSTHVYQPDTHVTLKKKSSEVLLSFVTTGGVVNEVSDGYWRMSNLISTAENHDSKS